MKYETALSFNDILLRPTDFSMVRSRADVDTSQTICGHTYKLPVIASNMDAVYSPKLAQEVAKAGGISCVHRFCSIEENVKLFQDGIYKEVFNKFQDGDVGGFSEKLIKPWVSIGIGSKELERAEALRDAGAEIFVIDVAHGAAIHVVEQFKKLIGLLPFDRHVVVGNFATAEQIKAFAHHAGCAPDAFKINIGSGSACTTRLVTGVGLPSVASIQECASLGYDIIQDGGVTNSGDLCKALALGAKAAFVGNLFASCEESGAPFVTQEVCGYEYQSESHKVYRGSASASSYKTQGKEGQHRAPEGEEYTIPISGTVAQLMQKFDGGLRSSMSYLGAFNLQEYKENAEFVVVTNAGAKENSSHGKST